MRIEPRPWRAADKLVEARTVNRLLLIQIPLFRWPMLPFSHHSKHIEYPSPRSTVQFSRVFSSITHQTDNLLNCLYLLNCHDRTKTPISWLLWYKIIWLGSSENNNMFLWSMLTLSFDKCSICFVINVDLSCDKCWLFLVINVDFVFW